jgi:HSP20 family molecular chaperone IbpA
LTLQKNQNNHIYQKNHSQENPKAKVKMLAFPRTFAREMRPFFRLLEDPFFEQGNSNNLLLSSPINNFSPSFDLKETKDSYVLDGELPGVADKSNLDLQFVDAQTLVIKGRIERTSSSDDASAGAEASETKSHKPSVEDETAEANTESAMTKTSNDQTVSRPAKNENHKYWFQERTVGEFQRSFSFPQNIDRDAVKASLKNGILSVVIPKKNVQQTSKKIQVE